MRAFLILRYAKDRLKEFVNKIAKDMHMEMSEGCPGTDIPALIEFLKNCNKFDEYFTNEEQLLEVDQFHTELLYSKSLTCFKEQLENILRCVQAIFMATKGLRDTQTCKDTMEQLKKIEYHEVIPGRKEEKKILSELVLELKNQIYELKDRLLEKAAVLIDKSEVIAEYECIQKKVREIENTGHKFRCFIDSNIIQGTKIMREELCWIVTVSREIYFETEQQKTKNENTPGKPDVIANELGRVEVEWEPPSRIIEHSSYEVLIYEGTSEEQNKSVQCKECTVVLENLKGDTDFTFKVRRVVNDDIGPLSITSNIIRTVRPAGQKYLETAKCFNQGKPTVYTLPMKEDIAFRNQKANLRRFEIGLPENHCCEKRVLFLGDAGPAVDYILNFALGISRDDGYIFTVKDRDALQHQGQHECFTEYIIYPEERSRVTHTLSLIDTPGFMNCYGIDKDEMAVQNVQALFSTMVESGSDSIDAICVLVNVDDFQLTRVQRKVLERALEPFGKDLIHNICLVATCADENEQNARTLAEELNIPEVLFADFSSAFRSEAFWKRNLCYFRQFLQFVAKTQTCEFTLSKEVLDARLQLKKITAVLEKKTNKKSHKADKLEHEEAKKAHIYMEVMEQLKQYKSEMVDIINIMHFVGDKGDIRKVEEKKKRQYEHTLNRFQLASDKCESIRKAISAIDSDIAYIKYDINNLNIILTDIALR